MKLGVDLDNVVFDFQGGWMELYRQWWGVSMFPHFDDWDAFVDRTHFKKSAEFYAWFDRAGGWASMPFIDGARGALLDLKRAGHTIQFVSTRPQEAYLPTVARLRDFGWVVTFTPNKTSVRADVWLDDAPVTNGGVIQRGDRFVVFDQPWNDLGGKQYPGEDLERVSSWAEFVELMGPA